MILRLHTKTPETFTNSLPSSTSKNNNIHPKTWSIFNSKHVFTNSQMFSNIRSIKKDLIKFYTFLNENINWDLFFTEIETKVESDPKNWNDVKILNRIKSKLWTDKDLDDSYSQGAIDKMLNRTRLNYFMYYNGLINRYRSVIEEADEVFVLGLKKGTELLEEFVIDLQHKLSVISTIFDLLSVKYKVVTDVSEVPKNAVLVTTGSISYIDDPLNLKGFKIVIDDYDNVCKGPCSLNRIKLSTKAMLMSQIPIEDIVNLKYKFIDLDEIEK